MSAMGAVPKTFKPQVAASSAVVGQLTFSVILWMALWVTISVSIIIVNKHVLYYTNFHYPLVLAVWHMVLATATSHFMIRTGGWQDTIRDHGSQRLYLQLGMIGLLFGGALAAGNAALLYISIPTVQMLKAGAPAATYMLGMMFGTERLQLTQAIKVLLVCTGVTIASHSDTNLTIAGVALQGGSILMDALRCCFLQKVLQDNKVNASPLVTLAYVAPFSAAGLIPPALLTEGPSVIKEYTEWKSAIPLVFLSGLLATALNFVVFKVISLTSALMTSLTGVMKDWVCILAAMHMYGTIVGKKQWLGYSVAIGGLMWYHAGKIKATQPTVTNKQKALSELHVVASDDEEALVIVQIPTR